MSKESVSKEAARTRKLEGEARRRAIADNERLAAIRERREDREKIRAERKAEHLAEVAKIRADVEAGGVKRAAEPAKVRLDAMLKKKSERAALKAKT